MNQQFKSGDKVTYVDASAKGRGIHFKSRNATVVSVEGNTAIVQPTRGRKLHIHIANLRLASQENALTTMLKKMGTGGDA